MKLQAAALGFRVKSGWAAVVVLTKRARAFELSDVSRVELSDPRLPETRQPYHAAMGKLETNAGKVNRRERIVRCLAQQSLANLLIGYRQRAYAIKRAAIVIGSQVDPSSIANQHIRAHALEGRLFWSALDECLRCQEIRTDVLLERNAYACAAARLKHSVDELKRVVANLGQSRPASAQAWRADQKLAAVAALFALG
jgi:hypothetical protein